MKIVTLLENNTLLEEYKNAHGLSFYIETNNNKILFDLGPKNDFEENANKLGVNLEEVDILVLSHAHNDHVGGLKRFLEINDKAKIYASRHIFMQTYKKVGLMKLYIGMNQTISKDRFVFIDDDLKLGDSIIMTSKVDYEENPIGDNSLKVKEHKVIENDTFKHEIYLIIKEDNKNVLFSGCSHKGISNIVDSIQKTYLINIDYVVGGFHLSHYNKNNVVEMEYIDSLSESLQHYHVKKYFSCHCTGEDAFTRLKSNLGHQITKIMTGSIINL